MHDMFIQSQQLVTSSSSSSGVVQPKKRKGEHYNGDNNNSSNSNTNVGDTAFVPQESVYAVTNFSQTDLNNASPSSQQPFVRASTIKLLDTYQRCGQKVRSPGQNSMRDAKNPTLVV
jgi:homeodomain interacting protein kinase